jgi:hypothetical protein
VALTELPNRFRGARDVIQKFPSIILHKREHGC